jgi:hypothetical protein
LGSETVAFGCLYFVYRLELGLDKNQHLSQFLPELTRNTPVMKPWAATQVISSGGDTSLLWSDGAGILVCTSWLI